MARLVYFLVFVLGLVMIMNITGYQDQKIDSGKFDFEKLADINKKKAAEIKELMQPKKVVVEVKQVKVEGPLVDLNTDQLKNGAALYKKCLTCHGKRGEGKKGQKAPAIGGQFAWYLNSQITNMQTGVRVNKIMMSYIKKLTPEDVSDLSEYISKLPYMGRN
jgi:cytochrome c553